MQSPHLIHIIFPAMCNILNQTTHPDALTYISLNSRYILQYTNNKYL